MNVQSITKEQAWEVRHTVMWPDKDFSYIQLKDDPSGMHYGLFEKGELKSVVSLFITGDEAQFRKFATLKEEQGKGYGSHLLKEVLLKVKSLGVRRVWCNARENKVSFYQAFNMKKTARVFTKSSTRYVVMELFF
ncbi:GNAT family N-acetyltransferase [Priestia megaterium]|jgi:GNAT superfamily N-acetyltransferase|uniref:GNAT family N-acetyltransferase n=1 Tax=Priestia megaterium TaxID=1404 RepID=UPI0018A2F62F|nr:GNAT family N-acetyltransferase [Priestia megaterium]MDR7245453.1 GNAT superfamily N-acetyltransferase [Priestia megaterium]